VNPQVFQAIFPHWIGSFAFTLVVEIPIFVLVARLASPQKGSPTTWRLVLAGAAGTCITHPLLWFGWSQVISEYTIYIVSGELVVAAIESFTFFAIARPIRLSTAIAASFIANGLSYALGLLVS
jgi:hypothetical protein